MMNYFTPLAQHALGAHTAVRPYTHIRLPDFVEGNQLAASNEPTPFALEEADKVKTESLAEQTQQQTAAEQPAIIPTQLAKPGTPDSPTKGAELVAVQSQLSHVERALDLSNEIVQTDAEANAIFIYTQAATNPLLTKRLAAKLHPRPTVAAEVKSATAAKPISTATTSDVNKFQPEAKLEPISTGKITEPSIATSLAAISSEPNTGEFKRVQNLPQAAKPHPQLTVADEVKSATATRSIDATTVVGVNKFQPEAKLEPVLGVKAPVIDSPALIVDGQVTSGVAHPLKTATTLNDVQPAVTPEFLLPKQESSKEASGSAVSQKLNSARIIDQPRIPAIDSVVKRRHFMPSGVNEDNTLPGVAIKPVPKLRPEPSIRPLLKPSDYVPEKAVNRDYSMKQTGQKLVKVTISRLKIHAKPSKPQQTAKPKSVPSYKLSLRDYLRQGDEP